MKIRVKTKLKKHQKEFFLDKNSPILHLSGGYGCGKTFVLAIKGLELHYLNRPFNGGLVVPSLPEFKKDMLPEMEEIFFKNRIKYEYNRQDHYFRFPFSRGKMHVATAERRIRGPNWAYALINEVTLIKKVRYQETLSRVRVKAAPFRQVASVGTPEGIGSDYHEIFVETPMKGSRIIYGSTLDNLDNLGENYIGLLEAAYDAHMLLAYRDGQFVTLRGNRFYYNYDPTKHNKKIPPADQNESEMVHFSLDFNVDPMVGTAWVIRGRKLQAFDEIVLNDADTNKMVTAMIARGYTQDRTIVYPDPSGNARSTKGQPDNVVLKNAGYEVRVRNTQPRFRERQLNMNNLFDKGLIEIDPDKCPSLKKDFLAVEQDKVTLEKIKTNAKLTHSSDGADYFADIIYPWSGKKPTNTVQKIR